jgi:hypothetical protein
MAVVQLGVTGALVVLVVLLAVALLRMRSRVAALEARPEPAPVAAPVPPVAPRETPEFVITRVGDEPEPDPVPTVPAPVFADIVARETVIQAASLAHGLRRALDPETRNRIRFHMRQEVRRSRKQRKAEQRAVRREWAARQREAEHPEAGAA